MKRSIRTIQGIQALRAVVFGCASVLLGVVLPNDGLSPFEVGVVLTAILVGMAVMNALAGFTAKWIPRRVAYRWFLLVMIPMGILLALSKNVAVLSLACLFGTFSPDANDSGPMTSLEQAMIAEAPSSDRLTLYSMYNGIAFAAGAVGALVAAFAGALEHPVSGTTLLILPVFGILAFGLSFLLQDACDGSRRSEPQVLGNSKSTVTALAALFSLDALGGGFVTQSFIAYWLHLEFHLGLAWLGGIFVVFGLVQALSSFAAITVGRRFGLLNTMVWSHIPSNLFLIALVFCHVAWIAILLLFLRFALSQMDVPTRQAYLAALVEPQERTAASAYTNTARYTTRPFGPFLAGLSMAFGAGVPFAIGGVVKLVYDGVIFRMFRRVPVPDAPSGS